MEPDAREDVERLFLIDKLPPGALPRYDSVEMNNCFIVPFIEPQDPWYDCKPLILDMLRSEVVHEIMSVKRKGAPPVRPLTLVGIHEVFANRDLYPNALLVNPFCVPHLAKARRSRWGHRLKVFEHFDVPLGEVYALAEPNFLGVVPVQNGHPGAALHNPDGVVWGTLAGV